MKLYAQVGFGAGDRLLTGLNEGILNGGIFSPKDLQRQSMDGKITEIRKSHPHADILFDPQFYVVPHADEPQSIGSLGDWDYIRSYRINQLEREKNVRAVLESTLNSCRTLDLSALIAPNIYISQSLDSREAVIAKSFLRETRDVYEALGDTRPIYASLVICREALQDRREFEEFLNDITMIESPPDGIYLLIAGRSSEARTEIFHADVLANWLLLNLSLTVNGMKVINGYSDLITPFLGAVGGFAGATGWWSNLRTFSLGRFFPEKKGGRQPIPRYLSKILLNRILFNEKDILIANDRFPEIVNGLPHDDDYDPEPDRVQEVLQSWETLQSLNSEMTEEDIGENLQHCLYAIARARRMYSKIAAAGFRWLDSKSNNDHIEPLEMGLKQFMDRAGLS